jgi:hypothetical protein
MLENGIPEPLAEERFVADEYVRRPHLARLQLTDETVGFGKRSH